MVVTTCFTAGTMLTESEKAEIRLHDLAVIRDPYVALGIVVLVMLVIFALVKVPQARNESAGGAMKRLWKNKLYREGVVTQVFYVASQIMVWTFII